MKTYPFSLATAENVARLFEITRGDEVVRFTDADSDITIPGVGTYLAEPGAQVSSMEFFTDGSVSNAEILINARPGGPLSDASVAVGRYDGFPVRVDGCDVSNTALGRGDMFKGFVGSVATTLSGQIKITARGPLTRLRADMSERYSQMCRADLGDDRCRVPILPPDIARNTDYVKADETASFVRVRVYANGDPSDYANSYWECTTSGRTAAVQPDYSGALTPGQTVTDGTAVFTNRNSFLRNAQIASIISPTALTLSALPDSRAIDEWFTLGGLIVREGSYDGDMVVIRKWTQSTLRIDTWDVVSHKLSVGMWVELYRGCQKTEADCNVFNAIVNRRAEPFAPGSDALFSLAT